MYQFKSISSRIILSVIPVISITTLIFIIITYNFSSQQMTEQVDERIHESSRVASLGMQMELIKNANVTTNMALFGSTTTSETAQSAELPTFVKESIRSNTNTVGGGIWYEPYAILEEQRHFSAYAYRDNDGEMVVTMDYANDIDYLVEPWYTYAIAAQGEMIWTDVYYDAVADVTMVTSSQAFFGPDGEILGVATADMALTNIEQIVEQISVGETGKAFVVGRTGAYITFIDTTRTFEDTIFHDDDDELAALGHLLSQNSSGSHKMALGDHQFSVYFSTLPSVDWKLVVLVDKSEIDSSTLDMVLLMAIVPVLGLLLVCISIILVSRHLRRIVKKVNDFADQAALGSLSERIEVSEHDEFGEMENHLNRMIENMGEMTRRSEEARQAAQAANNAKSDFLARMSHEIRTPMNAIMGMTQIASETDDLAKIQDCLEKTSIASKHLLGLINDILDMSKIEADKFELYEERFDLHKSILGVQSIINVKIEEKQQILDVVIDEELPRYVEADEMRLLQVIMNLLSNAVKFTPEEGKIVLSAELSELLEDDRFVLGVTVTDTGIGISEQNIEKLFGSFEQADGGIARKFGGTGLGLSISKRIVELMGGNISVASKLGEGTTFSFVVPMRSVNEEDVNIDDEVEDTSMPDLSGKTFLVAEDVEINREIVAALLEDSGVAIEFAVDGRGAIDIFSKDPEKFSLILMDIQMPEMDGYAATRQIRSMPLGKEVPIIALSANSFKEDVDASLQSGMNDHIAKPIEQAILISKIRKHLK